MIRWRKAGVENKLDAIQIIYNEERAKNSVIFADGSRGIISTDNVAALRVSRRSSGIWRASYPGA